MQFIKKSIKACGWLALALIFFGLGHDLGLRAHPQGDAIRKFRAEKAAFERAQHEQTKAQLRELENGQRDAARKALEQAKRSATHQEAIARGALEPSMDINSHCRAKWPNNYTMEEYCVKNQEVARSWVRSTLILDGIAESCTRKWPSNWEMFAYCAKNENEARVRLGR